MELLEKNKIVRYVTGSLWVIIKINNDGTCYIDKLNLKSRNFDGKETGFNANPKTLKLYWIQLSDVVTINDGKRLKDVEGKVASIYIERRLNTTVGKGKGKKPQYTYSTMINFKTSDGRLVMYNEKEAMTDVSFEW